MRDEGYSNSQSIKVQPGSGCQGVRVLRVSGYQGVRQSKDEAVPQQIRKHCKKEWGDLEFTPPLPEPTLLRGFRDTHANFRAERNRSKTISLLHNTRAYPQIRTGKPDTLLQGR